MLENILHVILQRMPMYKSQADERACCRAGECVGGRADGRAGRLAGGTDVFCKGPHAPGGKSTSEVLECAEGKPDKAGGPHHKLATFFPPLPRKPGKPNTHTRKKRNAPVCEHWRTHHRRQGRGHQAEVTTNVKVLLSFPHSFPTCKTPLNGVAMALGRHHITCLSLACTNLDPSLNLKVMEEADAPSD